VSSVDVPLKQVGWGKTRRTDNWWLEPLLIFLGYAAFIAYANWRVFENANYEAYGYLAPMYSPLLIKTAPSWWPSFIPFSAAMLILWAPAGFRFTCYYYRGAYYKGFWQDPTNCAVTEPNFRGPNYRGERKWPLIIQNIHRYFLYFAIIFIMILSYDAWKGMWFAPGGNPDPEAARTEFGIGIGTVLMILNPILIGLYTFGCHSFRHLIGGSRDVLSDSPARKSCYDCVSSLNKSHKKWAWISMFYVAAVDFYIRQCAAGIWTDLRIF
jgi:hypothetical protein